MWFDVVSGSEAWPHPGGSEGVAERPAPPGAGAVRKALPWRVGGMPDPLSLGGPYSAAGSPRCGCCAADLSDLKGLV